LLLEQHAAAGFPPDLALDLVLNELVARAADATRATAAALALLRGDLMVCRAATGPNAPDLGIPLDTRDGLSGACVRMRLAQLCADTESDSRVDPAVSRRQGIRSMMVVPVFDHDAIGGDRKPPLTGVLEVFSPLPNTFTHQSQALLADFADECARISRVAATVKTHPPAEMIPLEEELASPELDAVATESGGASTLSGGAHAEADVMHLPLLNNEHLDAWAGDTSSAEIEGAPISAAQAQPAMAAEDSSARGHSRQPYEVWTLVLGGLVILAAAVFSFMIGSRIGWLRAAHSAAQVASEAAPVGTTTLPAPTAGFGEKSAPPSRENSASRARSETGSAKAPASSPDELVVYDKNQVVFRMKPSAAEGGKAASSVGPDKAATQSLSSRAEAPHTVWLAPAEAESRLLKRVEPQYPVDAMADRRSGNVTMEVHVAEDGTVSSVRTLNGDPLLAAAAAEAVRNWRYQPFRQSDRPAKFQTDVTLTFSLPN
jgi:TonB family protein